MVQGQPHKMLVRTHSINKLDLLAQTYAFSYEDLGLNFAPGKTAAL
jgi:hypothetical protein